MEELGYAMAIGALVAVTVAAVVWALGRTAGTYDGDEEGRVGEGGRYGRSGYYIYVCQHCKYSWYQPTGEARHDCPECSE